MKKYHTVGTVSKSNRKIEGKGRIDSSNMHMYDR
jgi:hypothetical protein